jgi:HEAT repeat protein
MKYLTFTLSLFVAQLGAADFQSNVAALNSSNYGDRVDARNELMDALATASFAESSAAEYQSMLSSLYDAISVEKSGANKAYIIQMLGLFGDEETASKIYPLLGDKDEVIRDRTRKALSALPSSSAPDYLLKGLLRGPAEDRSKYIQGLAYLNHTAAWEPISKLLLKSPDPSTQECAAWALGKLKASEALGSLWAARKTAEGSYLLAIDTALLQIGPGSAGAEELVRKATVSSIRIGAFTYLISEDRLKAHSLLDQVLTKKDSPDRSGMIKAASESKELQQAVIDAVDQLTNDDKVILTYTLSDQRTSQHEALLIEFLKTGDTELQAAAADALGWIGSDESFKAMADYVAKNLDDDQIMDAMARLNAPEADSYFLSQLDQTGDTASVISAMKMVETRNSPGGTEKLNQIARSSSNSELREAAFSSLETIGNLESLRVFLTIIIEQQPLTRSAQKSLKRLSVSFGAPELQWTEAYRDALMSTSLDEQKASVFVVLDGVPCQDALDLLMQYAFAPEIKPSAIKTLQRWPTYSVANAWLEFTENDQATELDMQIAVKALERTFKSSSMQGDAREKAKAAAEVFGKSDSPEIKRAVASGFAPDMFKPWKLNAVRDQIKAYKDDPDVKDLLAALFE